MACGCAGYNSIMHTCMHVHHKNVLVRIDMSDVILVYHCQVGHNGNMQYMHWFHFLHSVQGKRVQGIQISCGASGRVINNAWAAHGEI